MPDDFDLRQLFGPIETDAHPIDTRRVIQRARRRRLPAQLAIGGGAVVAAGVLATGAIIGLQNSSSGSSTSSIAEAPIAAAPSTATPGVGTPAAGTDDAVTGSGTTASADTGDKRAPATKLNLCGGTLADVAPSTTGLVLMPHFPNVSADATSVKGTVTLTNTSDTRWTGTTQSSPSITLSQHGIVVWHTSVADSVTHDIDLAPGESTELGAVLVPVVCGTEDDLDGFRSDLPRVAPGDYQVSAAMDVPADEISDLVTGPTQTITVK